MAMDAAFTPALAADYVPLRAYLQELPRALPGRPTGIVVVSAHWEALLPTVITSEQPTMRYDYDGFPADTYAIRWDAPGSPPLAAKVRQLLSAAGIESAEEQRRGFDHGTFVPMKLAFPSTDIPTIELSLDAGYDRLRNARLLLSLSLVGLTAAYAGLALPGLPMFCLSIVLLTLGNALFKPSCQAVLAALYTPGTHAYQRAQLIFHLAVNGGSTAGALLAGLFVPRCGVRYALSGAACLLFLCCVLSAAPSSPPKYPCLPEQSPRPASPLPHPPTAARNRAIVAYAVAMLLFSLCFGQVDGALLSFTRLHVDRTLLGGTFPVEWLVGVPPALVLLLAPAQIAGLSRLQRRFSTPLLVCIGLLFTSAAFAILLAGVTRFPHPLSLVWVLATLTLLTLGESLIAPLSLAAVVHLAPPRMLGRVIGGWHIAGAIGYALSGQLGALWLVVSPECALWVLLSLPCVGIIAVRRISKTEVACRRVYILGTSNQRANVCE